MFSVRGKIMGVNRIVFHVLCLNERDSCVMKGLFPQAALFYCLFNRYCLMLFGHVLPMHVFPFFHIP